MRVRYRIESEDLTNLEYFAARDILLEAQEQDIRTGFLNVELVATEATIEVTCKPEDEARMLDVIQAGLNADFDVVRFVQLMQD